MSDGFSNLSRRRFSPDGDIRQILSIQPVEPRITKGRPLAGTALRSHTLDQIDARQRRGTLFHRFVFSDRAILQLIVRRD